MLGDPQCDGCGCGGGGCGADDGANGHSRAGLGSPPLSKPRVRGMSRARPSLALCAQLAWALAALIRKALLS